MDYLSLISLGISFLQSFLGNINSSKLPAEIATSIQAVITALTAHKNDILTKAAFEAQRG